MLRRASLHVALCAVLGLALVLAPTLASAPDRELSRAAVLQASGNSGTLEIEGPNVSSPISTHRFGVTVPGSALGGSGVEDAEWQPVLLSRRIDEGSPLLLGAAATGQLLDSALVRIFKPSLEVVVSYLLEDVLITKVKHVDDREKLRLDYRRITVTVPSSGSTPNRFCFDRATKSEC